MDEPILALDDVRFRHARTGDDLIAISSLRVHAGETLFIRGPSGCGKSTLLSLAAGVLLPQSGRVCLMGHDWGGLRAARRDRLRADHIGYVFQQFNLLPYLSVIDNVLLPCRFSRRRASQAGDARDAAGALLRCMGLEAALWRRPASTLSVGQQQRVAAARALIGRPELVIADEPTSALDESTRDAFMDLLLQACAESRCALLFVSHDGRLAARFGRHLDLVAVR